MPRKARIDAPGALHHIIVRGIEGGKIFLDDFDRNNYYHLRISICALLRFDAMDKNVVIRVHD
jgi:hypothetical protein